MAIDVVAVLNIPYSILAGTAVQMRALGDEATLLFTGIAFASEPEEIAVAIRALVGDALDRHDDTRGIYVFPSVAKPTASAYAALIDELGELGMWIPRVARDFVAPSGTDALAASLRDLQSAMPQELLAQLQAAMASGDQEQLAALGASVDQILATQGGLIERLQASIAGAFGGPDGAEAFGPEAFTPEALEQARVEIEAFARSNPELFDEMQKQAANVVVPQATGPGTKKR